MPESGIDKPRRRAKIYGIIVVVLIAIATVILVMMTHEPKSAASSTSPSKPVTVPHMAETKSEMEVQFHGKSFFSVKRKLILPFGGEINAILAKEGVAVVSDAQLVAYKLDRDAMMQVHRILYPEMVLNLKKGQSDQRIEIEKLTKVTLALKKIELEKAERDLSTVRQLQGRGMASEEAVKNLERQIEAIKKEIFQITESIKQAETSLAKTNEDLRYYEAKQKRDLDLLEWQTNRSYADSALPLDVAYLKAPIAGQVIWMSPDLTVNAECERGFPAMIIAATSPMVVRCKVHELELVKLKSGDRGTVIFDAMPEKRYACRVTRIPSVSRNPALEVPADYDIECLLEEPDALVRDGMTCNVKVSVTR